MAAQSHNPYVRIFGLAGFRRFWLGFTFSAVGDVISRVALTWFVFELTQSPEALGLLSLAYTGPVLIGGLVAGALLDRFDKRNVLIADSIIRGLAVGAVPLLHVLGLLELWHLYVVAAIYGSLMMISLAGSPALVPDLVDADQLVTANSLETLSFTLSGVIGPMIAGVLLTHLSAPALLVLDALSYFFFALMLLRIRPARKQPAHPAAVSQASYRLSDAVRLLLREPVLLSTTLMFMLFNLGFGAVMVALPILTDQIGGGADGYGILLAALAVGEVLGALAAGTIRLPFTVGLRIGLTQALAGAALVGIVISQSPLVLLVSLFLVGWFSAPLTIWAQTLRMQVIPASLRGRTFAVLRTLMQGTMPAGGMLAGFLLPALGTAGLLGGCALVMGAPGLFGMSLASLRQADEIRD